MPAFQQPALPLWPDHMSWETTTIEPETGMTGVVVGAMILVRAHWAADATRACPHFATKGALTCRCQFEAVPSRVVGYVPVYTLDKDKRVVQVSAKVAKLLFLSQPGTVVRFERGKGAKPRLKAWAVAQHTVGENWYRAATRKVNYDILEYLCHLWQLRPLTEHFGFTYHESMVSGRPLADPLTVPVTLKKGA